MRALVTGATGYIGSRLCRHLDGRGWTVYALTRGDSSVVRAGIAGFNLHPIDDGGRTLDQVLAEIAPDAVFHLAAAMPGSGKGTTERLVDANVRLAARLAEALSASPRPVLVHAATWWEWDRDGRFCPANAYAASKAAGRLMLETAARNAPFAMASLVLHDVYGPGDWRGKIIDRIVAAALGGSTLPLSPGEQRIDPLHVEDVCAAFETAALRQIEGDAPGAPACHAVATGAPVTLRSLVEIVERVSGRAVAAEWGARPHDPATPKAPGPMAPMLPGWTPAIGLEEGIRSLLREEGR